jgi:hypothetical protein
MELADTGGGTLTSGVAASPRFSEGCLTRRAVCLALVAVAASCRVRHPADAGHQQAGSTATGKLPRVFLRDPAVLQRNRTRCREQPGQPPLLRLLEDATQALGTKPFAVTEKTTPPPSGDRHDYLSLAPYYWPNPSTPDGLPYVRRDGQINPERERIPDHAYLGRICRLTETLGLAYYFTAREVYAEQAARLLETFLLDGGTRMNPHLRYAQGVRGQSEGRSSGIIDTHPMARLVDGVGLLAGARAWSAADQRDLEAWFRDYLTWLRESPMARMESQAKNNHGTWYDVQVTSLALATGQTALARSVVEDARERRIARQIETDGRQPEELERTRPWHYSLFNLRALVELAALADRVGVDLWRYQSPDGRSIRRAIEALLPYAEGRKPWPYQEIGGFQGGDLYPLLREAAWRLEDARWAETAARLAHDPGDRVGLFVE